MDGRGVKLIDSAKWDFAEKTRWLYTYFLGRLNTELQTKTISIEVKNSLEMYQQMCNIVDAKLANYKFFIDSQLAEMPRNHADKIKGLKDLYGFRLTSKKKVAAYMKAIGVEPDHTNFQECVGDSPQQLSRKGRLG